MAKQAMAAKQGLSVQQITDLEAAMNKNFFERTDIVRGIIVAALARQHIFLLGSPGTGKSAVSSAFCGSIKGNYFELLVGKFTTPEEMFGPFSLKALQEDRYRRNAKGKLPEANVAFLDEIFKSNSGNANYLLPIMNERKFYNDGMATPIDLEMIVGASNEIPESEELAALWDRFALRYEAEYIQDRENFKKMMKRESHPIPALPYADLKAHQQAVQQVVITDAIMNLMWDMCQAIRGEGFLVSDRKWNQIQDVIRAHAYVEGRSEVTAEDLEILQHVFWNSPDQKKGIRKIVSKMTNPFGEQLTKVVDAIEEVYAQWKSGKMQSAEAAGKMKTNFIAFEKLGDSTKNATLGKHAAKIKVYRQEIAKDLGL